MAVPTTFQARECCPTFSQALLVHSERIAFRRCRIRVINRYPGNGQRAARALACARIIVRLARDRQHLQCAAGSQEWPGLSTV